MNVASAENLLTLIRQRQDSIGVSVSFGKDSLCVLDLCCRMFPRVEAFYLYRVAGLKIVAEWAATVYRRHGVNVRMYPHFDLSRCYRHHVFQPHWKVDVPRVKMCEIENAFRRDAGVLWIAYGWRRSDSLSRALIMKGCGGWDVKAHRVYPLRSWRRGDVFQYLKDRGIAVPDGLGRNEQGGLDFHPAALDTLRRDYPDDWERWQCDFPFSGVQLDNALRTSWQ